MLFIYRFPICQNWTISEMLKETQEVNKCQTKSSGKGEDEWKIWERINNQSTFVQQWLAIHVSIDSFCKKADNCGYNNYVLYQINYEIDSKFLKLMVEFRL